MEFRGLLPPVITPFRDGNVDSEGIERLVDKHLPQFDGMVVAGSTGEGPACHSPSALVTEGVER